MPLSLKTPVLQVDANVIHKVDTTNPENLFSMWTVFARCRDSVAQGRRLENLSWRLWNRETFCCESTDAALESSATSQPRDIQSSRLMSTSDDLPQLSSSVESTSDEEAVDFTSDSAPVDILRPRIQRQDSCASSRSRGRERHITSDDLEKMVVSIIEAKVPLTAPLPELTSFSPPAQEKSSSSPEPERSGSTTTESPCSSPENPSMESLQPAHSLEPSSHLQTIVTRGFSPSQIPVSQMVSSAAKPPSPSELPGPNEGPNPKDVLPKKQQARFALGGSSGSGDDSYSDNSFAQNKLLHQHTEKKVVVPSQSQPHTFASSAISDGEQSDEDWNDESAIDDEDDSSDWEDSVEESGKSSMNEKLRFIRVDSKVNLTSRRSLITLGLANNNHARVQKLANNASQSTSAIPRARSALNGPSLVASPNDSDDAPLMMKRGTRAPPMRAINEVPRSAAQPIAVTTTMHHQAALSPRTTRRNMLATELTESLRRHLLWERSQKSSTANAVLKRRHTSQDVANLKQYPERPCMKDNGDSGSWNQYFNKNPFTGYHAEGW